MQSAKELIVKPISANDANRIVRRYHYSGKTVNNSKLHFGVFVNDQCHGAMQFGCPMDKRKIVPLVKHTRWNEMLELNRMAFSDYLARNSESRALGVCFKMIVKRYPFMKWIISYSDATQCGDGCIYRASGFVLTAIRKNKTIGLYNGEIVANKTLSNPNNYLKRGTYKAEGFTPLEGYQLRYVRFLDPSYRKHLTVPEIPFSKIKELGVGMYKGKKIN